MAGQGFVNTTTGGSDPNLLPATQVDVEVTVVNPLPEGSNKIGTVGIDGTVNVALDGATIEVTNELSIATLPDISGTVTVTGQDSTATDRAIKTDSTGALLASNTTPVHYNVSVTANTSTTLLAANANRLGYIIQLTDLNNVLINEAGTALTSMNDPGIMIYSHGSLGSLYSPLLASTSAVTVRCTSSTTIRVVEYNRV